MPALRLLLLAGCLAAVGAADATARWQGRLARPKRTWVLDLGRHPVWAPPPAPTYADFRRRYAQSPEFPRPWDGLATYSWDPAEAALSALLLLWPVTGCCGLLYLACRGSRRDRVLGCALSAAAGAGVGASACVLSWWVAWEGGPPSPLLCGTVGLVGGLAYGLASPHAAVPPPSRRD